MTSDEKIKNAYKQIEKHLGKGAIFNVEDGFTPEPIEPISTGSIALDEATGIGGIPSGRMIEIYGNESTGKSTLALTIIANAQKKGMTCLYIDTEQTLDLAYAKKLGVTNKLHISTVEVTEIMCLVLDTFIGVADVIVVDSIAASVPKVEVESGFGPAHMGVQAKLMNQAIRKINPKISKMKTTIIWLNQTRASMSPYGPSKVTTGGNALKFYATMRIELARIGKVKQGDDVIGDKIRAKITKNKIAPPHKQAEFEISFGNGIDRTKEIIELAIKKGILSKSGSWIVWEGKDIKAQGIENAKVMFADYQDELLGLINEQQ